jgi:hypothetical protein
VNLVGRSPTNSTLPYYLRVVDPQFFRSFYDWGSGPVLHGPPDYVAPSGAGGPDSHILTTLPGNVTAVGSDIMSFLQYASGFRVVVSTGGQEFMFNVPSFPYPMRAFVGFVSASPISAIRFRATGGFPVLDNFVLGGGGGGVGPPPTNLVATVSGSTVDFTWTAPGGSVVPIGYVLEAALTPEGLVVASLMTAGTSVRVTNVPTGVYYVHVRARYTAGASPPSAVVQVNVVGGPPAFELRVSRPTVRVGDHVTFSWTDQVLGPGNNYTLFVSAPGSSTFTALTFEPCCVFEVDVPPAPIGMYRFYVRATNGAQSNIVTLEIIP